MWAPKDPSSITQDSGDLPPPHDDMSASAWNRLWYGKFGATSATDFGKRGSGTTFGWGEIDAYEAVKVALALER